MTEGITTTESMGGLIEHNTLTKKEQEEKDLEKGKSPTNVTEATAEEAEGFESADSGMYLGYRVIEDDSVKELRLPKDVLNFLVNYANWETMQKKIGHLEEVPGKNYVCTKCGFKRPKIKGTHSRMFLCPKCKKPLREP